MKRFIAGLVFVTAAATSLYSAVAQDSQPETASPLRQIVTGEISDESMALGMQLVKLSGNSGTFNVLLPNIADQAKNAFIKANPQMQLGVIEVVDRVALSLVSRRPDLDRALARIWASGFTNEEMQELIDFYGTETGKKFASLHPQLLTVQMATAQDWSRAVGAELTQKVSAELNAVVSAEQKALQGDIAGPASEAPAPAPAQ
jgi:hypothetical protein